MRSALDIRNALPRMVYLVAIAFGLTLLFLPVFNALYRNDLVYWNVAHLLNAKVHLNLINMCGGYTMTQIQERIPVFDWYCKPDANGIADLISIGASAKLGQQSPNLASACFRNGDLTSIGASFQSDPRDDYLGFFLLSSFGFIAGGKSV